MALKPLGKKEYNGVVDARRKAAVAEKEAPFSGTTGTKGWGHSYLGIVGMLERYALPGLKGKVSVLQMGCGRNSTSPYILSHWLRTRGIDHELHVRDLMEQNLRNTKNLAEVEPWQRMMIPFSGRRSKDPVIKDFTASFMRAHVGENGKFEPPAGTRETIKFEREDFLDPNGEREKHDVVVCYEVLDQINSAHGGKATDAVNAAFMAAVRKAKTGGLLVLSGLPHEGDGHVHADKREEVKKAIDWNAYGLELVDSDPGHLLLLIRKVRDTL